MAERVHDCIGRLLADLVLEAAKPSPSDTERRPLVRPGGLRNVRVIDLACRALKPLAAVALFSGLALPLPSRAEAPNPPCDAPLDLLRLAQSAVARRAQTVDGSADCHRRHRLVIDRRFRRQFAFGDLSEPAGRRTQAAFPGASDYRAQSRRRRRGSARHAQAL